MGCGDFRRPGDGGGLEDGVRCGSRQSGVRWWLQQVKAVARLLEVVAAFEAEEMECKREEGSLGECLG